MIWQEYHQLTFLFFMSAAQLLLHVTFGKICPQIYKYEHHIKSLWCSSCYRKSLQDLLLIHTELQSEKPYQPCCRG